MLLDRSLHFLEKSAKLYNIIVVKRNDWLQEFTAEFTKEINDYLGSEQNITYSAAVAIVGAASIDGIILAVAGADGNFVG